MTTTDFTAQAFTEYRTLELERRNERIRQARERRAAARPVTAPSRSGFAAVLFGVLHGSRPAATH